MEIKTKYNIGDKVWWINDSKALTGEIEAVHFHQWRDESFTEEYTIKRDGISKVYIVYEKYLFPTKEELLKSL